MSAISTDVLVLGAGPGGAMAALFLHKEGVDCVVVDKAVFPRDKICGDALSGKVVEVLNRYDRALTDKLALRKESLPCWGVTFVAPDLEALSIPFQLSGNGQERERAPGFISRRMDFDNFLVDEVRGKDGIRLMEGCEIKSFERNADGYLFTAADGTTIQARMVIVADGAHSRFAKEVAGIEVEKEHYCAGVRAYYEGVEGIADGNYIELHFLKDLLPGYFWIFPLPDGGANVGLGIRSDYASKRRINLRKELPELIKRYPQLQERFKNARLTDEIRGYGLPLGSKKRPISGDHYLLVGDAASLIDPFTGEGIGNAMLSGMLAAQQAVKAVQAGRFDAAFQQPYDQAIFRRLWPELKLSYRMQRLVNYPWLFNFVVRKANRNRVLRETITVMFEDIDLRDRLRKPSFYFQLLFSGKT